MKVGIIVHSHTGNTLSVANRLMDKLINLGHTVNLEQVKAVNEDPSATRNIELKNIPQISEYEILIFGAPVWAFSLSPVMEMYLKQLDSINAKKLGLFVTQQLPYPFFGGNRSIRKMRSLCDTKSDCIVETGIINWSHKSRENKIDNMTEKFIDLLIR